MTDDKVISNVSVCISKELERRGYSKHKLVTTSWLVKIREFVENQERGTQPLFNTGSNAEGTDVTGSDRDSMVVFPNCVVTTGNDVTKFSEKNHVFLMDQDNTRPCYTKLILLRERVGLDPNDLFQCLGGKERLCVEVEMDRYLLSSKTFTELVTRHMSGLQSSTNHILSSFHVHGPCATFDNTVGKKKFETDFAYCLPCRSYTREALAFRSRSRQNTWPPETLIKNCFEHGCHIVAVGDKASPSQSVEWRISFALLERELVWSLNDTQCKCYTILKMLLKMHIDKLAPDELSSYALKTLIFWCAETEDPSFWKKENLLSCIYHCLAKLHAYISDKRLPHFIVPENNLLTSKFLDDKVHNDVTKLTLEMTNWHWSKLLQCYPLSALNSVWEEVNHDVSLFMRVSRHPNVAIPFYQDCVSFRALQSLYLDINSYLATSDDLLNMLESFKAVKVEGEGNDILDFGICALTYRISDCLRNASCPAENYTSSNIKEDILYQRTETKLAPRLPPSSGIIDSRNLKSVLGPDVCTVSLRSALNLVIFQKFADAEKLLLKVLDSYEPHVMYIGLCGPEELELIEHACYTSTSRKMSLLEKVQRLLAFDFTICKRDTVTPFLKREQLFWNEDDVPMCIHPKIMTYYLCFLSAFGQGEQEKAESFTYALSMNVHGMYKNKNLYSYIAWNLLGHCYFLKKSYRKAFKAFCNSLKSKPYHNPALYYMGQC